MSHYLSESTPSSRSTAHKRSRYITRLAPLEDRLPSLAGNYPAERMAALFWRHRAEKDEILASNVPDARIRQNIMNRGNGWVSSHPQQVWGHSGGAEGEGNGEDEVVGAHR